MLAASGFPPASHDGKALLNILGTFPRDELFQIGIEQLQDWTEGMLDLETRPRVRVFARIDRFDRFVSVLVYAKRDRYTTQVRERIGALLADAYNGRIAAFYPYFPEGPLVRVQFIVARFGGETPQADVAELERKIADIVRTWEDRLGDAIGAQGGDRAEALLAKYGAAFSAGYAETFSAERALQDIERIERLGPEQPVVIDFHGEPGAPPSRIHAAVYSLGAPIPLSQRVPVLENLGFSAIDERSYHIRPRFADGARDVTLHDMVLETGDGAGIDLERHDKRLEGCFLAVLRGDADNDGFNRLIVSAGADWREAATLRAYAAYLRQLGSPFGLRYLTDTLTRHAGIARDFLELFHLRFDPARKMSVAERQAAAAPVRLRIEGALAGVPSLDEDRILRQVLNLVDATVRTNFYQPEGSGGLPTTLAFKLDSKAMEAAPQPRPFREIWVYSPRVEGVHLRFGPIARGGIRWSDRAQDFRTEVLGLVRAQLVKNAVIVPSGAKGGFLPKQMPRTGTREDIQKEGVAAYRIFISALLDLTDNIRDGKVVPPRQVVRHDGDDAYLVVAADKGTATFSDIANEISAAHGFWLGDAFASGGSAGYDHKKMAITARGAWECVKRHFREMDIDIQRQPFRVVGVGDMSGDVFGNGMLLSEHIQLVAAFDHRDIFIDPSPGAGALAERKRLFDLPRSSWQDYDKAKISRGGGVFSRGAKSIPLSDEIKALLGVEAAHLAPNELMRAILKCQTDLLWFGGIGTYLRAATETDADVGDRANDPLRITAAEVRAKVIGEGANLGVTQRARIEFAARGGRINTDFIDNSAGVNTSDQEVNIKIAVAPATRSGKLAAAARNTLLADMTEDVAAASLRNNYQQSLALSLAERKSAPELADYSVLMRALEAGKLLDRTLGGAAERYGAAGAWARRARPHPAGACRAAELRQDRPAAGPAGERRAGRARARALAHRLFPAAAARALCRRYQKAQPAPRDHRARDHQRHRQPRRPGHGGAAGRRDAPHQRRCRHRVPRRARGVRAAGAVAADRCARRRGQGRRADRPLSGDAWAGERADALVPAQRRGAVRSRGHASPGIARGSPRCGPRWRTSCRTAARPSSRARRAGLRRAAFPPTSPPISPRSMCWGWRRRSPRSPRRHARPCRMRRAPIWRSGSICTSPTSQPRPTPSPRRTTTTAWRSRRRSASSTLPRRRSRARPCAAAPAGSRLGSPDKATGSAGSGARWRRSRATRRARSRACWSRPASSTIWRRGRPVLQHQPAGPEQRVAPNPPPAEARLLVSPHGGLVPDRHEAAAGHGQGRCERLVGEERERSSAEPAPAVLCGGDEEVDVPRARRAPPRGAARPTRRSRRHGHSRSARRRTRRCGRARCRSPSPD